MAAEVISSVGAELAGETVGLAVMGNVGAFTHLKDTLGDLVTKSKIDAATATAAGADVHVELDSLINLYNQLSALHTSLAQKHAALTDQVTQLASVAAGGQAPGVASAWKAIAVSAGQGGSQATMLGNLASIDQLVLSHMHAAMVNVTEYARNENLAIQQLGQAANAKGVVDPTATASGVQGPR